MPPPIAPPAAAPVDAAAGATDAARPGAVGATVSAPTAGDNGIDGAAPPPPPPAPAPPPPCAAGLRVGSVGSLGIPVDGPPGTPPDGAPPPEGVPPPEGAPPPDGAPPTAGWAAGCWADIGWAVGEGAPVDCWGASPPPPAPGCWGPPSVWVPGCCG